EYLLAEAVIERMSQLIDRSVMYALLKQPDIDLSSQISAQISATKLATLLDDVEISAGYDEDTESYRLRIDRKHYGNIRTSYLDANFLRSGDFAKIKQTAQMLQGLIGEDAKVKRGEQEISVAEFKEALEWLLNEAKKGL